MSGQGATHEATCPVGLGIDAVCDADRLWFDARPGQSVRLRPAEWAEQVEFGANVTYVRVVWIGPGVRARVPLRWADR